MTKNKKLYVGTVNGENGWYKKSANTFVYATNPDNAAFLLFKRFLKLVGKADVIEIFAVEDKKIKKVAFKRKWQTT